jgi:hypothetical protein
MTAWASTQAGDWSDSSENDTSPWYDDDAQSALATVPGNGDTVEIDHNVNVDVDTTVGTTPDNDSTDAILVDTGILTVNTGVTLTCRGRLYVSGATFTMEAGSSLILDSSQHASLTPVYRLDSASAANSFNFNGTSGSHVSVSGYNDTYRGAVELNSWTTGNLTATYTDFEDLDTGSNYGFGSYIYNGPALSITHCTFTDCSRLQFRQIAASADFVFTDNVCSGTGSSDSYFSAPAPSGGATRTFSDNVIDFAGNASWSLPGTTISQSYFHQGLIFGNAADSAGDVEDCFIRSDSTTTTAVTTRKGLKDSFVLKDSATGNHFVNCITADRALEYSGNILEFTGTANDGDGFMASSVAATNTATIKNNIVLPNSGGVTSSTLLSCLGVASWDADVYHNTACVKESLFYGEGYVGHAGIIANAKSNLWWVPSGETGYAGVRKANDSTPIQDGITPANYDYNWHWNLAAGSETGGFNDNDADSPDMFSTVPTNSNGGSGDPQFVDATRDLGSWGSTEESTDGSVAAALAVLQADTSKIPELVTWVKAGFVVQNSSLEDAGHDSETIGAMGYQAASTAFPYHYNQQQSVLAG